MTAPYVGRELPPHLQPPRRPSRVPVLLGVAAVVVLAVGAFLAFAVFEVQTLFTDETVAEEAPTFASGAGGGTGTDTPAGGDVPAQEGVTTAATGTFEGREHPGEGTVNLLTDGTQTFVRFEDDFATDNGPDLYAVVIVDGERVELGELKGNQGSQNYELPADIDPASVDAVQVWCKRFDAVFTEAAVS